MKKSLFTLAAVAAVMASCTSDELKVDNGQAQNGKELEIGFSTFTNKATRAAENSGETVTTTLLDHHDAFAVWGFKDVDDAAYIFGKDVATGTTVSGAIVTSEVLYNATTAAEKNATLTGAISTTTSLSAAQATKLNKVTGVGKTDYVTGDNPSADDAKLYNATLTGAVKDGDVQTPATYKWTYSPLRFWDKNSNRYDFYAAAPVLASDATPHWELNGVKDATDASLVAKNPQAGYFTLTGVTLEDKTLTSTSYSESMKAQANKDYMIANENHVEKAAYGSGDVAFDFNHILSRLNITVKKGTKLSGVTPAADAKLQIVKLEVKNLFSKGDFNENTAPTTGTLADGTTARWSNTSAAITYNGNVAAATDVNDKIYILQSLIIPQTATSKALTVDGKNGDKDVPYLYIEYKIGTDDSTNDTKAETFKAYYNLASIFGVTTADDKFAFNEGWQNTLNLTIDASTITFTANTYKWKQNENKDLDIK